MVQLGHNAARPSYLLACGSQVPRKQVGLGHRGAGLDWSSYNLLACRKSCSSGRTEAGMRRLKPCQPWPVKVVVALHISIQHSIRAGPVVIAPPRRGSEAWQPLKPQPCLTVADFFLHFFSTAPPGRDCTSFYGVEPRPGGTVTHCLSIYNPPARFSSGTRRRCVSSSSSVHELVWP